MTKRIQWYLVRLALTVTLAFLFTPLMPTVGAQDEAAYASPVSAPMKGQGENPHALIGTWIVQSQITNCSGVTLENFSKFVSINAGGTANEMSNSRPPSQRTVAFGVWEHVDKGNFVYALRFFRFNPDGTFAGTVHAKWNVLIGDQADSYTATATIQIVAPGGFVVANLCGTESATRMVVPE